MTEAKINGYKIREAVRQLEVKKSALRNQFNSSFYKFDDEEKATPVEIGNAIDTIESQIARLQEVQAHYNLTVQVPFKGRDISLLRAIKLVGATPCGHTQPVCQSASHRGSVCGFSNGPVIFSDVARPSQHWLGSELRPL